MCISIRLALPSEKDELESLQRRASFANEGDRAALLVHPEAVHVPMTLLFGERVRVCEIKGRIAGFSAVIPKLNRIFEIDGIFVEPDRWRGGIGRALITDVIMRARKQHATSLEVVANVAAVAFYERFGFLDLDEVQTEFGPARFMRLGLLPYSNIR